MIPGFVKIAENTHTRTHTDTHTEEIKGETTIMILSYDKNQGTFGKYQYKGAPSIFVGRKEHC